MTPPAPAADPVTAYTPRVLVFGLPRSGKTDLIRKIHEIAVDDSGVEVVDLTPVGSTPAVRGEVLRWVVPSPDRRPGSSAVVLYDCDGEAARELVKNPDFVTRRTGRSALTETVRASHAIVCLVNASANEGEVAATFDDMRAFVRGFRTGRLVNREVGGLPVFLVLTRCDELREAGWDRGEWENAVEQRKEWLRAEFKKHFGSDLTEDDEGGIDVEGATAPRFGNLNLRVRAVARSLPAFTDTTAHAEPWNVRELFHECAEAARQYGLRAIASRKRLRFTLAGAGLLVLTLVLGFATLIASDGFGGNSLAERVRALRATEGPPAERLSDRRLAATIRELTELRDARGFDRLPSDLRQFVLDRQREAETYRDYRALFRAPRLGPAEVRSRGQLDALAADLGGNLSPPAEFAAAWADTAAVKTWAKWKTDLALFTDAETQVHDWYRTLVRQANDLLLTTAAPDYGWRLQATDLLRRGDAPPLPPERAIEASPALATPRGKKLTYAAVYAFDRVETARADWADTRDRLAQLRDLTDALGLTAGPDARPAVLDLPEPGVISDESKPLAVARLAALGAAFPAPAYANPDYPEWSTDRFPDPVRKVLDTKLRQVLATGTRHVRRLIGGALGSDSQENWLRVADTLLQEEPLLAWGRLLGLLKRWTDPTAAPADSVSELAAFVRRDRLDMVVQSITVTVPDGLLVPRFVPAGRLVVTHTPAGGAAADFAYKLDGDGVRDQRETAYTFVADGHPGTFAVRPGDGLSAVLPGRSGAQDYRLVWSNGHSAVYQTDRLARTPRLEKVGLIPIPEPAPGVRLTTAPPGGVPSYPDLVPDLRAGQR